MNLKFFFGLGLFILVCIFTYSFQVSAQIRESERVTRMRDLCSQFISLPVSTISTECYFFFLKNDVFVDGSSR